MNPKDATSLLIQRILNQLSEAGVSTPSAGTSVVGQTDSFLSNFADYAQLLGTAEAPIASAFAEVIVAGAGAGAATVVDAASAAASAAAAAATASLYGADTTIAVGAGITAGTAASTATAGGALGAAAEATGITAGAAGAETAGIGAAIVLTVAAILAAIVSSSGSESSGSEEQSQLAFEFSLLNTTIQTFWNDKLYAINYFWGQLQSDLDDLAAEGTAGVDVTSGVANYHSDAQKYVNNLTQTGPVLYWERPVIQEELFSAQPIAYPAASPSLEPGQGGPILPVLGGSAVDSFGAIVGWYGLPPQGSTLSPTQQSVPDPTSMLPYLLLGIQSYLIVQALIHFIDTSELTFAQFLTEFRGDLQEYAGFLYSQYSLAVNGIVKSAIPQPADILGFMYYIAVSVQNSSFPDAPSQFGGSEPAYMGAWVGPGDAWNGVYGVVDKNPPFGAYVPPPPVPVPCAGPSCIIDVLNTENLGPELQQVYAGLEAAPEGPVGSPSPFEYFIDWLYFWTIPWTTARLILGIMARWKAIYLFKGYDKVWSTIQNLRVLSGQTLLPVEKLTQQDRTIANGNWSARELIGLINVPAYPLPEDADSAEPSTSLLYLVQTLDGIANGSWAAQANFASSGGIPSRPLGFRDRLAAAAVPV